MSIDGTPDKTFSQKVFARRGPVFLGGLLLGLTAMVGFMTAKRAFAPKFHPVREERAGIELGSGGVVRIVYNEDPGYYLPPGFPTSLVVSRKQPDGSYATALTYRHGQLVEKEPVIGPFAEEGEYSIDAQFFICAEPGVADCTKYEVAEPVKVAREVSAHESSIEVDLVTLARDGLSQGKQQPPSATEE